MRRAHAISVRAREKRSQALTPLRMPELPGSEMIQCGGCKDWFHIAFCITVGIVFLVYRHYSYDNFIQHQVTPCMIILDPLLTTYTGLPGPLLATKTPLKRLSILMQQPLSSLVVVIKVARILGTKTGPLGPFFGK